MGTSDNNAMDRQKPLQSNRNNTQQQNGQYDGEGMTTGSFRFGDIAPTSPGASSHLAAATSSPSLLAGCANPNTHAGANIERHVQAHNVNISLQTPLSPIPVSPTTIWDAPPFIQTPQSPAADIPDSVFLTPSPPRAQNAVPERPNSAPANYLERVSGQILRMVGNHYLCSTCGRQLRTIGDQLTIETSINTSLSHIRRALSANHLDSDQGN